MITCPSCGHQHEDNRQSLAGRARWAKLTPEERSAAGKQAAIARWFKAQTPEGQARAAELLAARTERAAVKKAEAAEKRYQARLEKDREILAKIRAKWKEKAQQEAKKAADKTEAFWAWYEVNRNLPNPVPYDSTLPASAYKEKPVTGNPVTGDMIQTPAD